VYELSRDLLLRLLRAPHEAPDPPSGSHASVAVFRASPRFLSYRIAVAVLGASLVVIALSIALTATIARGEPGPSIGIGLLLLAAIAITVLALFAIRIDYDLRYYIVTDRSLRVREGAWVVREKTLTYANVQNLRVLQGPVQRLFGIADLRVDTAGGGGSSKDERRGAGGHDATLAGIENAREVRDLVLAHVRRFQKDSGLGDPDDAHPAAPIEASRALVEELVRLRDAAAELRGAAAARSPR
jgi:membrane protein YdbS with pleckstrin-like domain